MKFLALEYMGNDLIWFVSWMKIPGEPRVDRREIQASKFQSRGNNRDVFASLERFGAVLSWGRTWLRWRKSSIRTEERRESATPSRALLSKDDGDGRSGSGRPRVAPGFRCGHRYFADGGIRLERLVAAAFYH